MATRLERHLWKQFTKPKYIGWAGLAATWGLLLGGQFKLAMSATLVDIWFCFTRAPTVCGASTRKGTRCSNNGKGLLRGCALQQHTEQRVDYLRDRDWAEVRAHFGRNLTTSVLFAGSVVTLVIGCAGWLIQLL